MYYYAVVVFNRLILGDGTKKRPKIPDKTSHIFCLTNLSLLILTLTCFSNGTEGLIYSCQHYYICEIIGIDESSY